MGRKLNTRPEIEYHSRHVLRTSAHTNAKDSRTVGLPPDVQVTWASKSPSLQPSEYMHARTHSTDAHIHRYAHNAHTRVRVSIADWKTDTLGAKEQEAAL